MVKKILNFVAVQYGGRIHLAPDQYVDHADSTSLLNLDVVRMVVNLSDLNLNSDFKIRAFVRAPRTVRQTLAFIYHAENGEINKQR